MKRMGSITLVVMTLNIILAILGTGQIFNTNAEGTLRDADGRNGTAAKQELPAPTVTVKESDTHGLYLIEGSFGARGSNRIAWDVLSDYDHISQFVSSMKGSLIKEHRPDGFLLEQEALGRAFFWSRHVHVILRVREEPYRKISFEDVSRKDFDIYEGSWNIVEPSSDNLRIVYSLKAKPRIKTPSFIVGHVFKTGAAALLNEVRAEILRRAGH